MKNIDDEIKKYLSEEELLCQLAEECNELAYEAEELREAGVDSITDDMLSKLNRKANLLSKTALKLRRVLNGINPTPKSEEEVRANLIEEAADVYNVLGLLLDADDHMEIYNIIKNKKIRWVGRLEDGYKKRTESINRE